MKTGLKTSKFRLNCSFRGWHYTKLFKNADFFAKNKCFTIKSNFQGYPLYPIALGHVRSILKLMEFML